MLKDAPILLLDEATSALDSEVEAAIQASLYRLMEGKTVVAIAHRLSTIAAMDRLIVLDKGRIVEKGDHRSLLAQGGLYARLWAHQSGGFLGDDEDEADPRRRRPRTASRPTERAGATRVPVTCVAMLRPASRACGSIPGCGLPIACCAAHRARGRRAPPTMQLPCPNLPKTGCSAPTANSASDYAARWWLRACICLRRWANGGRPRSAWPTPGWRAS